MGPLPVGSVLRNRYRISKILYQSKLTNVYAVQDTHLVGNMWAVKEMKVLAMNSLERQKIISQFQKEVIKMSQLSHPNLARIIDFFVEGQNLYIIREFIPAYDLETLMAKQGTPFREREVLSWGIQLADALSYLFSKKFPAVYFREFTLSNILVSAEGEVKLIDLGLARIFQTETDPERLQIMGSMDYGSPEQFNEFGIFDQCSLVYSLGAILFHLITKQKPSLTPFDLPPIENLNSEVSKATINIISKATENEPRMRYQALSDMKKDLIDARRRRESETAVMPVKEAKTQAQTQGGVNFLLIFLILALAGGIIFFIYKMFFPPGP